jgi:hypothetical protein
MFASSWWGGLWESTNRGTDWNPININPMNSGGVSAVAFLDNSNILIGDSYQLSRFGANADIYRVYSKAVWKYNFNPQTTGSRWTSLGALTNTSSIPLGIKSIAVFPGSSTILFVCTTKGLYQSTNGGSSWAIIPTAVNWIENMVFVPYGSSGNYYCYIAGSTGVGANVNGDKDLLPAGTILVKQSTNANSTSPTFTDLSSNFTTTYPKSVSRICKAPVDASNNVQFFLYTLGSNVPNYGDGKAFIHTFKKNVITDVLSAYENLTPSGGGDNGSPHRMAIAYDNVNNGVWYGGIKLSFLHIPTSKVTTSVLPAYHSKNGYIHDDMHDIQIQSYNGQLEMYVAHDGGIVKTAIGLFSSGTPPGAPDVNKLYFNPLNNGLHVSMIRGFSGTESAPNLYVLGGQDIVNSEVYDAATGKIKYTHETWENDGAMIDKFDPARMFFDANSYHEYGKYYVSINGGQTTIPTAQVYSGGASFYKPAAGNVFAQGEQENEIGAEGFISRQFYQDPYRPGRIYHGKSRRGISQYDPVSKTFVLKIDPWMIQPNLDWTCYSGSWKIRSWATAKGMSFSPQDPNSFHFVLNGGADPTCQSRASVIKYIGNNLDDCWNGHNLSSYTDASGTHPQWANITPNWESFGLDADGLGVNFIEIATSPWNKNVIYVMLYVKNHPEIAVLKYDGSTWSNYSTGLPTAELGSAMVMDYQSNDGLYLSTDMNVYYRDAKAGSQWQLFKTEKPLVPASQMEINYTENTVRIGTYGRGIWKTDLHCPELSLMTFNNSTIVPGYNQAMSFVTTNATVASGTTIFRAVNSITLNPKFFADATTGSKFLGYIHGCANPGNSLVRKNNGPMELMPDAEKEQKSDQVSENAIAVYPNPNKGSFTIQMESENTNSVVVYNIIGEVVFEKLNNTQQTLNVDISHLSKGIYIIKVVIGNEQFVKKVITE